MWYAPAVVGSAVMLIAFTAFSLVLVRRPVSTGSQSFHPPGTLPGRKGGETLVLESQVLASSDDSTLGILERRRIQLPFFAKCFQAPRFSILGKAGDCSVLHIPTYEEFKHALPEFREAATINLDSTRCKFYLNTTAPAGLEEAMELFEPVDVALRPKSTDHDVFLQVYCGTDFHFMPMLAQYMPLDRPVTFLDAGANIGMASLLFAQLMSFYGEVLSVDANPMTFELLKRNTARFGHVVKPIKAAVVNHDVALSGKMLNFSGDADQFWGFRVEHEVEERPRRVVHQVETISLPMLKERTQAKHFDFIKLDIEGEEKHILRDPDSIAVLCEAVCVFMELHDRFEPGCTDSYNYFVDQGCPGGRHFTHIATTGEYLLLCQKDAMDAVRQDAAAHDTVTTL